MTGLLLLSAGACRPVSWYQVILGPGVDREAAQASVDWINAEIECDLFGLQPGHGTKADWRWFRPFPPRGRVTIEVDSRRVNRSSCSRAGLAVRPPRGSKGRIYLDNYSRDQMFVMAHELAHIGGLGHKCGTLMGGKGCTLRVLALDEKQREKLRRVCDGGD